MIRDVVWAEPVGDYRLRMRFEDGAEGIVDVSRLVPFKGIFAPLESPEYFARVSVNPDLGTVCWPNGADLDPITLYSEATGSPLPTWTEHPATV